MPNPWSKQSNHSHQRVNYPRGNIVRHNSCRGWSPPSAPLRIYSVEAKIITKTKTNTNRPLRIYSAGAVGSCVRFSENTRLPPSKLECRKDKKKCLYHKGHFESKKDALRDNNRGLTGDPGELASPVSEVFVPNGARNNPRGLASRATSVGTSARPKPAPLTYGPSHCGRVDVRPCWYAFGATFRDGCGTP